MSCATFPENPVCRLDRSLINGMFPPMRSTRADRAGVGLNLTEAIFERYGSKFDPNNWPGKATSTKLALPSRG